MIFDYPYTDIHELNLDWFLAKFKELVEEWNQVQSEWTSLHDYVQNYFDNLNVQTEIDNKINAMILDGSFADIVSPFVTAALPALVAGQLPDVVASQLSAVVAAQISAVVADQLPAIATSAAAAEVSDWLATHIDPDTGYVIDDSLTVSQAAADAKVTGDKINGLKGYIDNMRENSTKRYIDVEWDGTYIHDYIASNHTYSEAGTPAIDTIKIECKPNTVYACRNTNGSNFRIADSATDPSDNDPLNILFFNDGTADKTVYVQTSSNAAYLIFTVDNTSNTKIDASIFEVDFIPKSESEYYAYLSDITWERGSINITNGTDVTANNRVRMTDYLTVKAGDIIDLTDRSNYDFTVCFYNKYTDEFVKGSAGWENTPVTIADDEFGYNIRITARRSDDSVIDLTPSALNGGIYGVGNIVQLFSKINTNAMFKISKWREKNIIIYGDSISDEDKFGIKKYCTYFSNWLKANVKNTAIGGAGYVNYAYSSSDSLIAQSQIDYGTDYDLVIIWAGTNDYGNSGGIDRTTFTNGVHTVIDNLINKYPDAEFLLVTPLQRVNGTVANSQGMTLNDYCEILRDVHKEYGIPIFDMYYDGNFHISNSDFIDDNTYNSDGLHPNDVFHKKLATMFISKLEEI